MTRPDRPLRRWLALVAACFVAVTHERALSEETLDAISGHWSFQPLQVVEPPEAIAGESNHPIDRFLAAERRDRDLRPVRQADARVLVRRLYFDLLGLPPSPAEVEAFLARHAASPDAAIEELIESLLASPHYGERWGRHWMDVVRYADTAGDNADYPVPEARLYRDYIIEAFNADKPYDQFVREQVAGDILAQQAPREQYAELVTATGFLALSRRHATAPRPSPIGIGRNTASFVIATTRRTAAST